MVTSVLPYVSPNVPANAELATPKWLAIRIGTFLAHFWTPNQSEQEKEIILFDWCEVLGDLPQAAIEAAIRERLSTADRSRPIPGEIRSLARAFIIRQPTPVQTTPFEVRLTDEEAERRKLMGSMLARVQSRYSLRLWEAEGRVLPEIMNAVCEVAGIGLQHFKGESRTDELSRVRFVACHLARKHTGFSFAQIGHAYNRDHTTVQHAVKRAADLLEADPDFRQMYEAAEARL